jgi:hypothetical protein
VIGWYIFLPVAAGLAWWSYWAGRTRVFERRRRRRAAPAPPGPVITERIEAHIAVGSLSGIAPSDIKCHVLLTLTGEGRVAVSGTVRGSLRALIVAKASAALAEEAFAAHDHDHEGER